MTSTSCTKCKEEAQQYSVDIMMAFAERTVKRLWIVIILLIVLLVGSNCAWIYYESQFEEVTTTTEVQEVTQDAENGTNNFVGGDSVNGEADSQNNKDNN